jgi:hypothetical protein
VSSKEKLWKEDVQLEYDSLNATSALTVREAGDLKRRSNWQLDEEQLGGE